MHSAQLSALVPARASWRCQRLALASPALRRKHIFLAFVSSHYPDRTVFGLLKIVCKEFMQKEEATETPLRVTTDDSLGNTAKDSRGPPR